VLLEFYIVFDFRQVFAAELQSILETVRNWTFVAILYASTINICRFDKSTAPIAHPQTGKSMTMRRIRLVLFEPTRDGETEVVVLTNSSKRAASAIVCCNLYRDRWGMPDEEFCGYLKELSAKVSTQLFQFSALVFRKYF